MLRTSGRQNFLELLDEGDRDVARKVGPLSITLVTFAACPHAPPHCSARGCSYKKSASADVSPVSIYPTLYSCVAFSYSQYHIASYQAANKPCPASQPRSYKLSILAPHLRRPLGLCLALKLQPLHRPRPLTMAWRSSGSSNESLIENLEKNGLIETSRVKNAMLQVLPTTILVSRQEELHPLQQA